MRTAVNLPTRTSAGHGRGAVAAILLAAVPVAAEPPAYDRDITPILRTYCAGCHNDADKEGEFSVERYATLRAGGAEAGDPIVPGDPAASALIARIRSSDADHMPPADEPQPPAAAVAALEAWIAAGGRGPAEDISLLAALVVPQLPPHEGARPVTALAVAADGGRLAVARGRGVELLDATRGVEAPPLATLADVPATVTAVRFDATGGRLVVAGGIAGLAGEAQIRDATTGAVQVTVGGHRDLVYDAELSPDGTTLATCGYDRSIKLWNAADGRLVRSIDVHDGPVFDVAWHPGGRVLASASADETVKLWRPSDGVRLDTLSQPQAELFAVAFTPAGHLVAAGRDRQIHLWRLAALDKPALTPPPTSRFAHESPIVALAVSADGTQLLSAGEDRSLRGWRLPQLELVADLPRQPDVAAAVATTPAGGFVVGRMDGSLAAVPALAGQPPAADVAAAPAPPSPAPADAAAPAVLHAERESNDVAPQAEALSAPVTITGAIDRPGDADCFRFAARAGRPLLLEVNAARGGSKLDSRLEILDTAGEPVERVVLQATRDSWLTFRGKNSEQTDDFRVQNWMEMQLDEYLYVGGEVVKLWHFPRGPDSGFKVYPGEGKRWTYFGTTAVSHPLGEPAWIVAPLPAGAQPVPNGLPVFRVFHDNDDEPTQSLGRDSQLLFTPPADGEYVVRITDVRGFGAGVDPAEFRYTLEVRPPRPGFGIEVATRDPKVSPGSGREIVFIARRREGFAGPIRIEVANLPDGFTFHGPLEIEAGQNRALGVLSAAAEAATPAPEASAAVRVTATATIDGRSVVEEVGSLGTIAVGDPPAVTLAIVAAGAEPPPAGSVELTIRPGETITARVRAVRHSAKGPITLGANDPGRNLPHGVYVDNIGLNGLMMTESENEREFFITAAPIARPGRRLFHVRSDNYGGEAALPVIITVVPDSPPAAAGAAR